MELSIIVPCYNVEKYVGETYRSLIRQDLRPGTDYEIIFVNDCSTDGTIDVLRSIESEKGVRIIDKHVNEGVSAARNSGLAVASGRLVWFVDGDDYIRPDVLGSIISAVRVNPDAAGVKIDACNVTMDSCHEHIVRSNNVVFDINHISYIVRRDYITSHGIYYPTGINQGEDTLFVFQLHAFGGKFVKLTLPPIYCYRLNPASISHTHSVDRHKRNMELMLDYFVDFRRKNNDLLSEEVKQNLNQRIKWATANVLADAVRMDQATAISAMCEMKKRGLYPYPVLWERLTMKFGLRSLIVNIINLPLSSATYYRLLNKLYNLRHG